MNYYMLIPLFFILIMIFPVAVKIKISFNILENMGTFALYIFGIKIKSYIFYFRRKKIILRFKKKKKVVDLSISERQIRFLEQFSVQVKDKLKVKNLTFVSNVGMDDNMKSAMISGFIYALVSCIFAFVKNSKPSATLDIKNNTSFKKLIVMLSFATKISISLFDVIYSFILSIIITRRLDKYETV